jgi:hypothetical protein
MRSFWQRRVVYLLAVSVLVSVGIWAILYFDLPERILLSLDSAGASTLPSSEQTPSQNTPPASNPTSRKPPQANSSNQEAQPIVEEGRLIGLLDGRIISDEQFQLTQTTDGLALTAQGYFYPTLLIIRATVDFSQEMQWGNDFRPQRYDLEAHGPLGFGDRSIQIEVELRQAIVKNGGNEQLRPLASGPFFLAGSFSSYTILPKILSAHAQAVHLQLPVFPSGWRGDAPAGDSPAEQADFAPDLTLDREGAATLIGNDPQAKPLDVERYTLTMGKLTSDLFIQGDEFIASSSRPVGPDGVPELVIYRADIFPEGFRILSNEQP